MNAGEGTTTIGKTVKIVGDFSSSEDVVLDGELQGTVKLTGGRLTLGPSARVRGDIGAHDVVIFGRVDGDIRAAGRVELRDSAMVQGNIYASSISMQENAAFRGQVDPSRAGEAMPEKVAPVLVSRPAAVAPAPIPLSYTPPAAVAPTRTMPAALAAVAAARSGAAESVPEDVKPAPSSPLFAETEA